MNQLLTSLSEVIYGEQHMEVKRIPIEQIKTHSENKEIYGDIANDKLNDLMNSLDTEGQLEPIHINQNFEIISGHRRFEAAKRLKWATIDAIQETINAEDESIQIVSSKIKR
jgi:ParB family transcriptional regulator, chromosome partitioning protein